MKKAPFTKAMAQTLHARKRLGERYGLWLTVDELPQIVHKIKSGQSIFTHKETNRISRHLLFFREKLIYVCYDHQRNTLITALPLDEIYSIIDYNAFLRAESKEMFLKQSRDKLQRHFSENNYSRELVAV